MAHHSSAAASHEAQVNEARGLLPQMEAHSIDRIPDAERQGTVRHPAMLDMENAVPTERQLSVAVCQAHLDITSPDGMWRDALVMVSEAIGRGNDLVVLPELATTGYVFADPAEARQAGAASRSRLNDLVALTANSRCVVVTGWLEVEAENVFNSAAVITQGHVAGSYRKVHLWDAERTLFTPGDQPPLVVDTPAGRVGVMVCYDLEFPEFVRLARQRGADLIAAPVNWPALPHPADAQQIELTKAQANAASYRIPIAIADRHGPERGVQWVGGSCIVGADGYYAAPPQGDNFHGVLHATVAVGVPSRFSEHNDALLDRSPHLYPEG